MILRAAIACSLAAVLATVGASVAAAADPAGFRGSLTITHTFGVEPVDGVESHITGPDFEATYRLRGRRWTGRFATPRTYLLSGSGHEAIDLFRRDVRASEGGRSDLGLIARAEGNVRLVRRPNEARETGSLTLRLLRGGRVRLSLLPLEGGEDGLPVNFYLERDDAQPCFGGSGGNMRGKMIFFRGVFEVQELEHCPDADPFPGSRQGTPRQPTIWGADIWNPPEGSFPRPDLCRGRTAAMPNLTVCGRRRGARISGRKVIGHSLGYITRGICAFFPRGEGPRELFDPTQNFIMEACMQMDVGGEWRRRTVVRWSFRPTR